MKHKNMYYITLAITALFLVSLACGNSATEKLQEAVVPTVVASEADVEPAGEELLEEDLADTVQTESLPTALPPTPTPEPEPITVTKYGFGQDGRSAGFSFIIENPNMGLAFEGSQYQLAAYDENGIVVDTDSGYINLLLPGQSLGISGDLFLDEGVTISIIEIQLNAGDPEPAEPMPTFNVESATYHASDYFSHATGVINNPYDIDLTDLRVSAIVYDEAGNIIGGGYTYQNFILANGSSGVEVSVTSAGDVASVELYPTLSSLSLLLSDEELPDGASEIQLVSYGFGQDERSTGFGMLIKNPNSGYAVESSQYQLTAFAADGKVLVTDEGYINLLLPKQLLGLGGDLFLGEGMEIDHIEVQIKAGEYVESETIPLFTYENAIYQPGSYSSKVTGLVVSPYTSDITDLRVSAIAYDENGEIIGGGYTYLNFAPANGKAAVEVSVTVDGTPFSVELFATVTSLSDFE